jgi:hypothetical protein
VEITWPCRRRILNLFLLDLMTVAWWARRSRSAVVSFSSPRKTLGHSPKARLVVTRTDLRWPSTSAAPFWLYAWMSMSPYTDQDVTDFRETLQRHGVNVR